MDEVGVCALPGIAEGDTIAAIAGQRRRILENSLHAMGHMPTDADVANIRPQLPAYR